jgi:phosphohistidine phosphatase SixA
MKEKLQQYALLAEIISAAAIVASLIFVGVQIKQNNALVKANTYREIRNGVMSLNFLSFSNPEYAALNYKISNGKELSPVEIMQRRAFGFYLINLADTAYEQHQRGLIDGKELRETLGPFLGILSQNPWLQDQIRQYSRFPDNYDPKFIAYIKEQMDRAAEQWRAQVNEKLAGALREGGYVIVMRHASSPEQPPDAATANPDNVKHERQLDTTGRREAQVMGEALRKLGIPVGEVLSSPAYQAMETARLLGFPNIVAVDELGNEGMRASNEANIAWLRANVAMPPAAGNRLLVTHGPDVTGAFPEDAAGMKAGDALIFHPTGKGEAVLISRLKITDWPDLK